MKTYSTKITVGAEHLDGGNHANWLAQLKIAQDVHFVLREQLDLGLEKLRDEHGLFLVMRDVDYIRYREQVRLGDVIHVVITMWISRRTSLGFHCLFKKDGKVAMETSWIMPLISMGNGQPCKIPSWMIDVIGPERPETQHSTPASTST